MVTESQHIDYHFSGLEDDDEEIENNEEDSSEVHDDGELSFEYRVNEKDQDADSSTDGSSQVMISYVYGCDDIPVYPFPCANVFPKGECNIGIINEVDKLEMLMKRSIFYILYQ